MIPPSSPAHALLTANAKWADAIDRADPGFFAQSAKGQSPKILWIGCADSRVPESVLTGARPGDLFVHRNIANQFHPDDDSALAVLQFAVDVVGVEHVVVAGHTQCGGAAACLEAASARSRDVGDAPTPTPAPTTPLGRWLEPLTDLVASLDLSATPADAVLERVVNANVVRQVENVCAAQPVQRAWAAGKPLSVHGWVYDLASGRLKDLGITRGPSK